MTKVLKDFGSGLLDLIRKFILIRFLMKFSMCLAFRIKGFPTSLTRISS